MTDVSIAPLRSEAGTRAAAGARYEALDALRGLAAIMVVLFHCEILSHLNGFTLVRRGEVFVDFFFVLSGFVIASAYADRLDDGRALARFAVLRVGRIWPLHMAMLIAFIAVEIVKYAVPAFGAGGDPAFTGANAPLLIPANILLVQAFGFSGELSWNTPAWSISAEMAAYAVFALAAFLAPRRLPAALTLVAAAAFALLLLDPEGMATTARSGAARALYGFSIGALLVAGLPKAQQPSPAGGAALAAELAAALLVIVTAFVPEGDWRTYIAPFAFAVAVHVFAQEAGPLSALLKTRPLAMLGALSYGVYMVHMFINLRLLNVASLSDRMFGTSLRLPAGQGAAFAPKVDAGGPWAGDLATLALIGVVILVAMAAKRFVEDPGRALARRLAARL